MINWFRALLDMIQGLFHSDEHEAVQQAPQPPRPSPKPKPITPPAPIVEKAVPVPAPITWELYEGRGHPNLGAHIEKAKADLFYYEKGALKGPTKAQEKVIFSDSTATAVLAGAGSGKSTTLVSRVLFLHKHLDIPLGQLAVFTFTRKSRHDFIKKLLKEAKRWGVPMNKKRAKQLVRTFHSKALQVAGSILEKDTKIFEFLGAKYEPEKDDYDDNGNDIEITGDASLAAIDGEAALDSELNLDEEKANSIEGLINLDQSLEQQELLKEVYSACYASDDQFKAAIADLFEYWFVTQDSQTEEDYNKRFAFADKASKRDADLCDYFEAKWEAHKCWPIPGVLTRKKDGSRFELNTDSHRFFANGYIESLDIYVLLGPCEGVGRAEVLVGKSKIWPISNYYEKRGILLHDCPKKIKTIDSALDANNLRTQLELKSAKVGLAAPAILIRIPGDKDGAVFSTLYNFGVFVENIGLNPSKLHGSEGLPEFNRPAERSAIYAVTIFFREFYAMLERRRLVTFNQLFSKLSKGSDELKEIGTDPLMSMKHLMIDEFQDISPLIVDFVQGLHEALVTKTKGKQRPTLMCVGDDWQSIYGWRGSLPHFFLDFHGYFKGAPKEHLLLEENFRSSQRIIDCGEAFMKPVVTKRNKHGIAARHDVKDLPFAVVAVEEFNLDKDLKSVSDVLRELIQQAGPEEEVYLLAARNTDHERFIHVKNNKFTRTSFHQSKGLEAEYVVLIGSSGYFGINVLKNALYKLAELPGTFDAAQRDEAFRLAYVAATRAKKLCIWYGAPGPSNVLGQVSADGINRQVKRKEDVIPYIQTCFQSMTVKSGAN